LSGDRNLISPQKTEIDGNCDFCGARMELRDIDEGPPVWVCARCQFAKSASSNDFARWAEGGSDR